DFDDAGGSRRPGRADRGFTLAILCGCRVVAVRHGINGHIYGHRGAQHAAVRAVAGAHAAAAAHAFGRHDTPCKHARPGSIHHAGSTHRTFREPQPGDLIPRRGHGSRMALIPGTLSDRLAAVRLLAAPFQENTGANGVSAGTRHWPHAVSTRRMPTWSIPASLKDRKSTRLNSSH